MLKSYAYPMISKLAFGLIYYDDIMQHLIDRDDLASKFTRELCMKTSAIQKIARAYERAGAIFIHIPKNAGTSISDRLYGTRLPHMPLSSCRHYFGEHLKNKVTFAVYRDPFERFISAYYFCLRNGTDTAPLSKVTIGRTRELKTLDDYLFYVKDAESIICLDHVFRPQHWYIADKNSICAVDYLYDISKLHDVEDRIFERGGTLPVLNVGRKGHARLTRWQRSQIEILYEMDFALMDHRV